MSKPFLERSYGILKLERTVHTTENYDSYYGAHSSVEKVLLQFYQMDIKVQELNIPWNLLFYCQDLVFLCMRIEILWCDWWYFFTDDVVVKAYDWKTNCLDCTYCSLLFWIYLSYSRFWWNVKHQKIQYVHSAIKWVTGTIYVLKLVTDFTLSSCLIYLNSSCSRSCILLLDILAIFVQCCFSLIIHKGLWCWNRKNWKLMVFSALCSNQMCIPLLP